MALPTPEEVKAQGGEVLHYTSKAKFEKAGGRTQDPMYPIADYVVVAAPATYSHGEDVENPMEAIDAYWELFESGGWTVFVWDTGKGEGWAYQYVGPEWTDYLQPASRGTPPTPSAIRKPQNDRNLLHKLNRYRRSIGHTEDLQPGEWTDDDIRELLSHAPSTFQNPGRGSVRDSLKRKLMR
jgi:hypothetical protein